MQICGVRTLGVTSFDQEKQRKQQIYKEKNISMNDVKILSVIAI